MSAYGLFLLLVFGLLIAAALVLFLPMRRTRATTSGSSADDHPRGPIDRDDERYWLAGLIYYNPDDHEIFVPKRYGLGLTLNLGHPTGKLIMIGMLLLPIALTVLTAFIPGINASYGCHPFTGCHLTP